MTPYCAADVWKAEILATAIHSLELYVNRGPAALCGFFFRLLSVDVFGAATVADVEHRAALGATLPKERKRQVKAGDEHEVQAKEATNAKQVEALRGQELTDWVFTRLSQYGIIKHLTATEKTLVSEALGTGVLDGRRLVKVNASLTSGDMNALALASELRKHLKT